MHCHPSNKEFGKYWVVDYEPKNTYKSPLMHWSTASEDFMARHSVYAGTLEGAVKLCESLGMGYDIVYP